MTPCVIDTVRFFDATTQEWGYQLECLEPAHNYRESCPDERELFRQARPLR